MRLTAARVTDDRGMMGVTFVADRPLETDEDWREFLRTLAQDMQIETLPPYDAGACSPSEAGRG